MGRLGDWEIVNFGLMLVLVLVLLAHVPRATVPVIALYRLRHASGGRVARLHK